MLHLHSAGARPFAAGLSRCRARGGSTQSGHSARACQTQWCCRPFRRHQCAGERIRFAALDEWGLLNHQSGGFHDSEESNHAASGDDRSSCASPAWATRRGIHGSCHRPLTRIWWSNRSYLPCVLGSHIRIRQKVCALTVENAHARPPFPLRTGGLERVAQNGWTTGSNPARRSELPRWRSRPKLRPCGNPVRVIRETCRNPSGRSA